MEGAKVSELIYKYSEKGNMLRNIFYDKSLNIWHDNAQQI